MEGNAFSVLILLSVILNLSLALNSLNNVTVLPISIIPDHYEVRLSPRLSNMTFTGHVVISGVADRDAGSIVLNSNGLLITYGVVLDEASNQINISKIDCSSEEMCEFELEEHLQMERMYSIILKFSGNIRNEHGIYADKYVDSNGTKHWIVMTEFQPVHARKAFPCFDEPAYKAQFLLHIARPADKIVLSNMPLNHSSDPDPNEDYYIWDVFERTPPMSTYLIAFVISDYVNVTDSKTNTSVWGPVEKVGAARHSLQVGVAALLACQEYFGIGYDFPKIDHIPVPSQVFSAMENWGIIIYVMEVLFYEESISTTEDKLWNTAVIMHEVSHQWLGNLVTHKWWSFTWLNEGFATFFNNLLVDQIEPSWRMMDIFAVMGVQQMMAVDFDQTSHPLVNNVMTTSQINLNFDVTTYDKGAAVINMVYHFLTPEVFQKGVNLYLVNNAYSNVEDEDLWVSLESNVNNGLDNLQDIMYNWTYEVGYPLISVQRKSNRSVVLTQKKYEKSFSGKIVSWWVPLTYTTSKNLNFTSTRTREWFDPSSYEHILKINLDHEDWIILNIRQNGYYRVNYDNWTWQLLIHHLKTRNISDIHPVNRAMLIDDAFNLAQTMDLSYDIALNLSSYLHKETDYIPWVSAIRAFNDLRSKFYGSEEYDLLKKYLLEIVDNVYNNVSFEAQDGDMITKLNRMQIFDFACSLGHQHCESKSLRLVYLLMSDVRIELPVDLKATILCTAVRVGHVEAWNFVEKLYMKTTDKVQNKYIISALGCSRSSEIILRLLKDTLQSDSFIREEDAFSVLQSVSIQRHNSRLLLNFVSENIFPLIKKFSSKISILLTPIADVIRNEEDQMRIAEVIKILRKEFSISDVKINTKLNENYFNTISEWLSKRTKDINAINPYTDGSFESTISRSNDKTSAPERTPVSNHGNLARKEATTNKLLLIFTVIYFSL